VASEDHIIYAISTVTGELIWNATTGDYLQASPVVSSLGDRLYLGSADHKLYAWDALVGGEPLWVFDDAKGDINRKAALSKDEEVLYVGSHDHTLYAVNTTNGKQLWKYVTNGMLDSAPVLSHDGQLIYFGSHDNVFYAIDPMGRSVWNFSTGGYIMSSPCLSPSGDRVYVGSGDHYFYSLVAAPVVPVKYVMSLEWVSTQLVNKVEK